MSDINTNLNSLTHRIIPCLDVTEGRVVKGVNFLNLVDAGNPIEIAKYYNDQGADELIFLDISATNNNQRIIFSIIDQVASQIFIPLTVGGGVRIISDVQNLLDVGADKVSINSAAVSTPDLIKDAANHHGSQCVVVAIDARCVSIQGAKNQKWEVFTHGGKKSTGLDVIDWAKRMADYGAGEILLTSMDRDGTKKGFDLELIKAVTDAVSIPVIASGGVGNMQHLADGIIKGHANAVLAASIFHQNQYSLKQCKKFLSKSGISIRLNE